MFVETSCHTRSRVGSEDNDLMGSSLWFLFVVEVLPLAMEDDGSERVDLQRAV